MRAAEGGVVMEYEIQSLEIALYSLHPRDGFKAPGHADMATTAVAQLRAHAEAHGLTPDASVRILDALDRVVDDARGLRTCTMLPAHRAARLAQEAEDALREAEDAEEEARRARDRAAAALAEARRG